MHSARVVGGLFALGPLMGCDADPLAAPESQMSRAVRSASLVGPAEFFPEDFDFSEHDAAPAINRALRAAADAEGIVVLGRDHTRYVFRSHIRIREVTLAGRSRSIKLVNGGGTGDDGRPARILMSRRGTVRNLNISPTADVVSGVPGIDSGADRRDGSADHWTVDNCEIHHFTGIGINFGNHASFVTITNNHVHHNGDAGVQINTHCYSSRIAYNVVTRNARNGIDCNGSDNVIERNACRRNGTESGTTDRNGIFVGGIGGMPANGNIVRHNTCLFNHRCGIFIGGETMTGTVVSNNIARENAAAGIMVEALLTVSENLLLTVTDNQLEGNSYYGLAENGRGRISYAVLARNRGRNNRPKLLLRTSSSAIIR